MRRAFLGLRLGLGLALALALCRGLALATERGLAGTLVALSRALICVLWRDAGRWLLSDTEFGRGLCLAMVRGLGAGLNRGESATRGLRQAL